MKRGLPIIRVYPSPHRVPWMLVVSLMVLISLMLISCTVPFDPVAPNHPDPQLKAQLSFTVDNEACNGSCVAQRRSLAKISFQLPDKSNLVLINTCGRQDEFWNPDPKKQFSYSYTYAMDAESNGSCPLLITIVTLNGEFHRGIIDWTNINSAPAKVDVMCNGRWRVSNGMDFCSVAAGLPIMVRPYGRAVIARDPNSDCPEPNELSSGWEITTHKASAGKPGLCVYVILNEKKEEFRLTTHAYSSIMAIFPPKK